MKEIVSKEKCNGCHACSSVCPKNSITMQVDKEGFWYPKINQKTCIDCGLCAKTCPVNNPVKVNREEKDVLAYAVKNKDEIIRLKSSSGGMFTVLAKAVLDKGGVVFGAAFDKDFNVYHTYVTTEEDLEKFRGSKYVQSRIGDSYLKAEEFLKQGRYVLFTGTPCQVGGLKAYLKKEYPNLYTQDIICHGVPSPKVWQVYLKFAVKDKKIKEVSFRDKENGWDGFLFKITFDSGEELKTNSTSGYMKAFVYDYCLRNSCYQCSFKSSVRCSDFTIADYWGVNGIHPEFNDNKGTSLVFVNSMKASELFEQLKDNFDYILTDKEHAIKHNPYMVASVKRPWQREKYIQKINAKDFDEITSWTFGDPENLKNSSLVRRIIGKIKRIVKKIIRR